MGDANHSTAVGRKLAAFVPAGPLKAFFTAGDFVADKIIGKVVDNDSPVTAADAVKAPEFSGLRQSIVSKVLAGEEAILAPHDFDQLDKHENELADKIALLSSELMLTVALRKAGLK